MDHTITIAISLALSFIAVFTGVLMNNNRLNDVKELLRAEIKANHAELHAEIQASHDSLRAEIRQSHADLTNLILSRFSEFDVRLAHIEDRLSRIENERRLIS